MAAPQSTPVLPALGRITWMLLGPVALALLVVAIIETGEGWLTLADILFFVALGATLLGRWLEFTGGRPETATGEPATAADLNRFLVVATFAGLLTWLVANLFANNILAV